MKLNNQKGAIPFLVAAAIGGMVAVFTLLQTHNLHF